MSSDNHTNNTISPRRSKRQRQDVASKAPTWAFVSATGVDTILTRIWRLLQHSRLSFVANALRRASDADKQLIRQSRSSSFLPRAIKACGEAHSRKRYTQLMVIIQLATEIDPLMVDKPGYQSGTSGTYAVIQAASYGYMEVLDQLVAANADLTKREQRLIEQFPNSFGVVDAAICNNQMPMLTKLMGYQSARAECMRHGGVSLERAVLRHNSAAVKILGESGTVQVLELTIHHSPSACKKLVQCLEQAYGMGGKQAERWAPDPRRPRLVSWSFPYSFRLTRKWLQQLHKRESTPSHLKRLPLVVWERVFSCLGRAAFPPARTEAQIRAAVAEGEPVTY